VPRREMDAGFLGIRRKQQGVFRALMVQSQDEFKGRRLGDVRVSSSVTAANTRESKIIQPLRNPVYPMSQKAWKNTFLLA
jgi:hypothetical protein